MIREKRLAAGTVAFALASSLSLMVYRIIFMKKYYNPYSLEYDLGAKKDINIFGWLLFAAIILVLVASLLLRKTSPSERSETTGNLFSVFCCALCGAAFIITPIIAIIYYKRDVFSLFYRIIKSDKTASPLYGAAMLLCVILMFFAGVYFLFSASVNLSKRRSKSNMALLLPVWGILFVCISYFDPDYIYSDYNRILANTAAVSCMVLMLLEARLSIKRPVNSLYFFFALATTMLVIVYAVPTLILYAFWEPSLTVINVLEICEIGIVFFALSSTRSYISDMK